MVSLEGRASQSGAHMRGSLRRLVALPIPGEIDTRLMSSRQGRPTGPTPRCIFCDGASGSPMSGEHLWSDWMSSFIPKGAHDSHIETWDTFNVMTQVAPTDLKHRHGHTTTRKLRRVCRSCNNGWMGDLEQLAKPHLSQMMSGQSTYMDADAQKNVVNWITLKGMVFENNRREDAATTLEQRQRFMTDREIPAYTQIHLFRCGETPWDWQFHRHSASFIASPTPVPLHPRTKNAQSFVLGVGELLFYVLQAFAADIEFRFERVAARQVWPPVDAIVMWPPVMRATRDEAEHLAANMEEFIRENSPSWRPG